MGMTGNRRPLPLDTATASDLMEAHVQLRRSLWDFHDDQQAFKMTPDPHPIHFQQTHPDSMWCRSDGAPLATKSDSGKQETEAFMSGSFSPRIRFVWRAYCTKQDGQSTGRRSRPSRAWWLLRLRMAGEIILRSGSVEYAVQPHG